MKRIVILLLAILIVAPLVIVGLDIFRDPGRDEKGVPAANASEQVARGAYLARAGDCVACHTARGGSAYAGGRALPTPFGTFHAPNITPDVATGIGAWIADDFWRALHNGKSRDGSFLYPAFPYPNYTKITRTDSDAMYAYFRTLAPVHRPNQPHELQFPYSQRWLLAGWRALYFRPGTFAPQPAQSAEWNRGAYLVQGLGHCNACHTPRNALGAVESGADLAGGMMPVVNWYAPSLTSDAEAGLGDWEIDHIAQLLKTGVSPRSTVFGPMAEVVRESLQHLTEPDIRAMSGYLKTLPQTEARKEGAGGASQTDPSLKLGAGLYEKHCAECHRADGGGIAPAYPPLAGNRALTTVSPINPIRMVLNGGYPPSTAGNPRPYGMPPFGPVFSDAEAAAVVSYIRNAWGNSAPEVTPADINRYRAVPLD